MQLKIVSTFITLGLISSSANAACKLGPPGGWSFTVYSEPNCHAQQGSFQSFRLSESSTDIEGCFNITVSPVQSFVFQADWPWDIQIFEGLGCNQDMNVMAGTSLVSAVCPNY